MPESEKRAFAGRRLEEIFGVSGPGRRQKHRMFEARIRSSAMVSAADFGRRYWRPQVSTLKLLSSCSNRLSKRFHQLLDSICHYLQHFSAHRVDILTLMRLEPINQKRTMQESFRRQESSGAAAGRQAAKAVGNSSFSRQEIYT